MDNSELEGLIENEEELFKIINFWDKAAVRLGTGSTTKDYGLNSSRNNEVKWYLGNYHGFTADLDHGFSGAYGEWDRLGLYYKGKLVLKVNYSGHSKYEYQVNFSDNDKQWRMAMRRLLKQRDIIERDKKAYEHRRVREEGIGKAKMRKRKMLAEMSERDWQRTQELKNSLNGFEHS